MTARAMLLAAIPALVWAADHYEYHDLGILRPGEPTSARVDPPGTVLTGRNVSSTLIAWAGGPQQFTGTVSTTGAGAHEGFFHGTYARGGTDPGRVLEWDMKTAAKIADVYLTSATTFTAVGNPDNTRKTIGVCETVVITANISMDAWFCPRAVFENGSHSAGAGQSVTIIAPDYAETVNVYAYKDGYARSISFNVIPPSSVAYTAKTDLNGEVPAGVFGTIMNCTVVLQPTNVSFGNIKWFEEDGTTADPTTLTGVFSVAVSQGANFNHDPSGQIQVLENNSVNNGDKVGWKMPATRTILQSFAARNAIGWTIPTKYEGVGGLEAPIETVAQTGSASIVTTAAADAAGPYTRYQVTSLVAKKEQSNSLVKLFRQP